MKRIGEGQVAKFVLFLLVVGLAFSFAIGCEPEQEEEVVEAPEEEVDEDMVSVGFIVKTMANPYYERMMEGAQNAADDLEGVELIWVAAEEHDDVEGQLMLVEDMIERNVDVLVVNPSGPEAIVPAIDEANEAGIKVIVVDTVAAGGDIVTYIGVDDYSAAKIMAEFVADYLGGEGNVAILEGVRGHSTADDRLDGYNDVLDEYPDIEVVASLTANWDRAEGMSVTEDILTAHPDLDFIIASNDEMAMGAYRALEAAGRADDIGLVGFDALDEALDAIQKGELLATMENIPDEQGYQSVVTAVEAYKGEEFPPEIIIDAVLVTQDNVEEYMR